MALRDRLRWLWRSKRTQQERVARAEAMMREAIAEVLAETGCRVIFQPMPQRGAVGAVVVTAGWVCVPSEALGPAEAPERPTEGP